MILQGEKMFICKVIVQQKIQQLLKKQIQAVLRKQQQIWIEQLIIIFKILRIMPIIQLKAQHQHQKKKSQSVTFQSKKLPQQAQIIGENRFGIVPGPALKGQQLKGEPILERNINKESPSSSKHFLYEKQQQLHKKEGQNVKSKQRTKKQQKSLKVQIMREPMTLSDGQPQQSKVLQSSIISQPAITGQKKGKKKKRKQMQAQQEINPEERLKVRTLQLYSYFTQRHKITPNYDYPQLMSLLKQSYSPFAQNQIQQQKRILTTGQDPSKTMNIANQYNVALLDELNKRKHFHEDRIYLGVLQQNQLFNDLIWRQEVFSQPKKQQVSLLFNEIHMLIINDVWEGQYQIKPKQKASKDEIIYGSYKANQIRMAQSIIKEKLSNLNDQFTINVEGGEDDPHKFSSYKKFDLSSEQTKKAEEFVKKLQEEEKLLKDRARKIKQQEQQQEIKRLEEQREIQKRQQQQKMQQRRVRLLQKAQQRQRLKKYRQQQQKQYEEYLSQHRQKTPLFKKKEEDFKAFFIKQQIKKLQVMKQIQKHKRSISKDQIEIHQLKYKELKDLLEQERLQMLKLQQEQAQDRQLTFYKGKFHESIMSDVDRKTIMDQKKSKAEQLYTKKVEYGTIIKTKFVPKIDLKKKEELQLLIKDLAPKTKDDKLIAQKTKMEGQRNLQKLHQMMGEMRAKGKIKKPQTPQLNMSQEKTSRYINYLNDIKTSRMNDSSSMRKSRFTSLDVSKMNRNSLGMIELQAMNLEQQADRKSLFLKNTKNLDMEDYLQRKFQLEDDYIDSAKVKLQVLSKYEQGD